MKEKTSKLSQSLWIFVILILVFSSMLASCKNEVALIGAGISHDTKFDSAEINISIEDFNSLGFNFGDSCNIEFSNGCKINDVPYYNGYYVKNGQPVIVGYPSNKKILITYNNVGIWQQESLTENFTVNITLNKAQKYLAVQEALGQSYPLERSAYTTDEQFSNFRALSGGSLKQNLIYRGASPVDDSRNRAKITDDLLAKNNINCIIDLADSQDNLNYYLTQESFSSVYAKSIYQNGKMILLSMGSGYSSLSYKQSVVQGLKFLTENDGPYYIHCMEGKDRTGFVCVLIEALCGATYQQMCDDYMVTYENYYQITLQKTPEKYNAIVSLYFDSFMECLHQTDNINELKNVNYVNDAKSYLISGGMSNEEIEKLLNIISK